MQAAQAMTAHPSGDKRFKLLEATVKRHQFKQDALIEILHAAQELFGYLEPDLLYFVAHQLKLPPSKVYGVATFYHFFSLRPRGVHTCVVCTGTACYVKGADELVAAIQDEAGIAAGETTADNQVSLVTARCLGACGVAPAVVLDDLVRGNETPAALTAVIRGWLRHGSSGST
jgi:bidirectional [NiFe] hydrogenase diaphorase subunit